MSMVPRRKWYHGIGKWLFTWHCRIVFNTYLKVKTLHPERLPKAPFIICSNHESHLDAILLSYIATRNFNKVAMVAAKDYWFDHSSRRALSEFFFNIIPVDRREKSPAHIQQTLDMARRLTAKGTCVVILPEGSRSRDGSVRSFKRGVESFAEACQVPVVPVYISGSGKHWPKGSHWVRPGRLTVNIGDAIPPCEVDASELREKVIELSNEQP